MPLPKALLAELVIMALLATIAKSHHALAVAVRALNWVEDYAGKGKQTEPHIFANCKYSVYKFPMDSFHLGGMLKLNSCS